MEIIAKISKGTNMDQIYIPKERVSLAIGEYVIINPINRRIEEINNFKPFFYNALNIEPIKLVIIKEILDILKKIKTDNIIFTGSFLEKGFKFNDIDILILSETEIDTNKIKKEIDNCIKIKTHVINLDTKTLISGLSKDPLYEMMLSKSISQKRFIFKTKRVLDYKYLDLQLLKSKSLIDNFDFLNGNEKYYLTLNMFSISLFIDRKKLSRELVEKEIEKCLKIKISEIKENIINKNNFIRSYKKYYEKLFYKILNNIKNEQK